MWENANVGKCIIQNTRTRLHFQQNFINWIFQLMQQLIDHFFGKVFSAGRAQPILNWGSKGGQMGSKVFHLGALWESHCLNLLASKMNPLSKIYGSYSKATGKSC